MLFSDSLISCPSPVFSSHIYLGYSARLLITPFRAHPKGWRYKQSTTVVAIKAVGVIIGVVVVVFVVVMQTGQDTQDRIGTNKAFMCIYIKKMH